MLRWQENYAQLHLEITSSLATRAEDFGSHDVTLLKELMEGTRRTRVLGEDGEWRVQVCGAVQVGG